MPFNDDFDLDLVKSGNGGPGEDGLQSTSSEVSKSIISIISGSVLTGCSDKCFTINYGCSGDCTNNCTAFNSCGCNVTQGYTETM